MAKTVIGYFANRTNAEKAIAKLTEVGYDRTLINIIYREIKTENQQLYGTPDESEEERYDNTIQTGGPVAEYREALFAAEINEEDAIYYNDEVNNGSTLIAVFVPTNPREGRDWENQTADSISQIMGRNGAYDKEIRAVYSNRGMTTYPQNRWSDPASLINPRDRIYRSASPLNAERSTVVGDTPYERPKNHDLLEDIGTTVNSADEYMSDYARHSLELLEEMQQKSKTNK
jgi:hypothetical protein